MKVKRLENIKKNVLRVFWTAVMGVVAISMVTPFIWMLSASMKLPLDVMELPIKWIPDYFYPDNYMKVWNINGMGARDYHLGWHTGIP